VGGTLDYDDPSTDLRDEVIATLHSQLRAALRRVAMSPSATAGAAGVHKEQPTCTSRPQQLPSGRSVLDERSVMSPKQMEVSVPTPTDRHRLRELLDASAQLVEVLPADEHLPGALNIPLKQLEATPPNYSTAPGRLPSTAGKRFET
jgi:hypothetical protein